MEPSEKLKQSMLTVQTKADELVEFGHQTALQELKNQLIQRAELIAEKHATINNPSKSNHHAWDYYSDWACYREDIENLPDVQMRARLRRTYTHQLKAGRNVLDSVTIDFSLFDTRRSVFSDTDEAVITFGEGEIKVKTEQGVIQVEPASNEWFDIHATLDAIDQSLSGHSSVVPRLTV